MSKPLFLFFVGTSVGHVNASVLSSDLPVFYEVSGEAAGKISVNNITGELVVIGRIDYDLPVSFNWPSISSLITHLASQMYLLTLPDCKYIGCPLKSKVSNFRVSLKFWVSMKSTVDEN